MALQSQGIIIRRGSSTAGATVSLANQTDIGFSAAATAITRQAGFAGFDVGMRVEVNASLNKGCWTVKGGTAGTAMTVQEALTLQASGATVSLLGHTMQNIGQIVSFNGPNLTAAVIDVTNLQSTAKEKTVGVYDSGNLQISVILDNESSNNRLHLELAADDRGRVPRPFDIRFTETATVPSAIYFNGYVQSWGITGAVDNALKGDMTIVITSGVDFTTAI